MSASQEAMEKTATLCELLLICLKPALTDIFLQRTIVALSADRSVQRCGGTLGLLLLKGTNFSEFQNIKLHQ